MDAFRGTGPGASRCVPGAVQCELSHGNIAQTHCQKLFAVVAVCFDRSLVYDEECPRPRFMNPHGVGVAFEQKTVLLFALAELESVGTETRCDRSLLLHSPVDNRP